MWLILYISQCLHNCGVYVQIKLNPHLPKKFFFCFNESSIQIMNIAFYFTLKALFILKIFSFCSEFFGYVWKWLDKKAKVNFKIYHITNWNTNNYNEHITRYLKNKDNHKMKFGMAIKYKMRNIFLKSCRKWDSETISDHFLFFRKALHEVKASG